MVDIYEPKMRRILKIWDVTLTFDRDKENPEKGVWKLTIKHRENGCEKNYLAFELLKLLNSVYEDLETHNLMDEYREMFPREYSESLLVGMRGP